MSEAVGKLQAGMGSRGTDRVHLPVDDEKSSLGVAFGVVALTETLRLELKAGDSKVSASVLCPGAINTQIVFSKRNSTEESAQGHISSAAEKAFEKGAGALLADRGKDPSEVADMVCNAIVKDDFWILTHSEWKDVLTKRVAALVGDNSLYRGFGG